MRGETDRRVAMSLLASPSLTSRTTSRSVGVSEAHPLAGRLRWPRPRCAWAMPPRGERGALGPPGLEVVVAQSIPWRRH